jgi:hypothetical protein
MGKLIFALFVLFVGIGLYGARSVAVPISCRRASGSSSRG